MWKAVQKISVFLEYTDSLQRIERVIYIKTI